MLYEDGIIVRVLNLLTPGMWRCVAKRDIYICIFVHLLVHCKSLQMFVLLSYCDCNRFEVVGQLFTDLYLGIAQAYASLISGFPCFLPHSPKTCWRTCGWGSEEGESSTITTAGEVDVYWKLRESVRLHRAGQCVVLVLLHTPREFWSGPAEMCCWNHWYMPPCVEVVFWRTCD